MRGFYGSSNSPQAHTHIDFEELFNSKQFNVAKLLNIPNIIEQVRYDSEQLTDKLIKHPEIIIDLFEISFRPEKYHHPEIQKISNDHTYKAIEILNNLSEEFSQFLMTSDENSIQQKNGDEGFRPNNILLHCLSILKDQKPIEETPLAYFSKVVTSLCYQKPKQLIEFITYSEYSEKLFDHFYSRAIYDFIMRIIEIEEDQNFFQKQKIEIVEMCHRNILAETDLMLSVWKLENYCSVIESISDKMVDRFDKAKYTSLARVILSRKSSIDFLIIKFNENSLNEDVTNIIINIFDKYMGFSLENRKPPPPSSPQSRIFDRSNEPPQEIKLNQYVMKETIKISQQIRQQFLLEDSSKFFCVNYLKLVKSIMNIDAKYAYMFFDKRVIKRLLRLVQVNQNNNILHNSIKMVIVLGVKTQYQHTVTLLCDQKTSSFLSMARKVTSKNSSFPFENQVYHIFQEIIKHKGQNLKFYEQLSKKVPDFPKIQNIIQEKSKFYLFQSGGNARKISSCWGESQVCSEKFSPQKGDEEKKIQFTIPFTETNQEHWVDDPLPVDSDSSREQILGNELGTPKSPTSKGQTLWNFLQNPKENIQIQKNFLAVPTQSKQKPEKQIKQEVSIRREKVEEQFQICLNYQIDHIFSEFQ